MPAVREIYGEIGFQDEATSELIKLNKSMDASLKEMIQLQKEAKNLEDSVEGAGKKADGLGSVLSGIAGIGLSAMIKDFATESIHAAIELEKQQTILKNLAGEDFPAMEEAIRNTIISSQGLADDGGLMTAANQALKLGADVDFVSTNLANMQKMAAVTGGSLDETMGKAQESIATGRIGFLKSNAIFASYIDDFKAIGGGFDDISKKRREALITNVLQREANTLQGQYNEHMKTAAATTEMWNNSIDNLKGGVGAVLLQGLQPLLEIFIPIINYFNSAEDGTNRLKLAMMVMGPVIGTVIVGALYSMAAAGWAAIAPLLPFIAIALAVGVAIAVVVAIIDDLFTFMEGGDSAIGGLFEKMGLSPETIDYIRGLLNTFWEYAKEYGKYLIMVIFPISLVYFYWDEIVAFLGGAIDALISFFSEYGEYIIMALFPLSALYFFWDEIVAFVMGIPDMVIEALSSLQALAKEILADILPDWALEVIGIQKTAPEHRAGGGPVAAGQSYLVGENGPELLTMGSSGSITPNNALGGGGTSIGNLIGTLQIVVDGGDGMVERIEAAVYNALNKVTNTLRAEAGLAIPA